MDSFNAKKSRARKLKSDKHHDRSHKKKSGTTQAVKSKTETISKVSEGNKLNKEETSSSNSDSEENESQKYSRGKIVSNQAYYDESLPDNSSEPTLASLEELAASSDVTGGIFQFKDETDWAACSENISSQYFHLDLMSLSKSLASVPFYERVDLSNNYYSPSEKQKMDDEAKKNYQLYSQSLNSAKDLKGLDQLLFKVKNQQNQEIKSTSNTPQCDNDNVLALTAQFKNIRSDLTDLLTSKTEQPVPAAKSSIVKQEVSDKKPDSLAKEETEDLTEWLDSILDD